MPKIGYLRGMWVVGVLMLIIVLRYNWTFHEYVERLLDVPRGNVPGGDAPFYFLRVSAVDGICAGTGFVLSLLLAAVTWKRYRRESIIALFMGWIWCLPSVVNAIIIVANTSHLMDAQRAVSSWQTFHAWMNDPLHNAALFGTPFAALPLLYYIQRRYGSEEPNDMGRPALLGSARFGG